MTHASRAVTAIEELDGYPAVPDARYYSTPYIESLNGGGLIKNGSGRYRDNTNFSRFTFDPLVANSSAGSFRHDGSYLAKFSDESFDVLPGLAYKLSVSIKTTTNNTKKQFVGLAFFDTGGASARPIYNMFDNGTLAELTRDFEVGIDSHIYIDNVTGFSFGALTHQRGFIFWNYTDSNGLSYSEHTYSRNVLQGIVPNSPVITDLGGEFEIDVMTSWHSGSYSTGDIIPAGTKLSRMNNGGTYKYIAASNEAVPTDGDWHNYAGYVGGVDVTGTNKKNAISPGARTAKLVILPNLSGASPLDVKVWFANLDFRVDTSVNFIDDGVLTTTGALGDISYPRGYAPRATSTGVTSELVIP